MKVKIDKKEFEELYSQKTNAWLASHYGVSSPTIVNWGKKLGLTKQRANQKRYEFI